MRDSSVVFLSHHFTSTPPQDCHPITRLPFSECGVIALRGEHRASIVGVRQKQRKTLRRRAVSNVNTKSFFPSLKKNAGRCSFLVGRTKGTP